MTCDVSWSPQTTLVFQPLEPLGQQPDLLKRVCSASTINVRITSLTMKIRSSTSCYIEPNINTGESKGYLLRFSGSSLYCSNFNLAPYTPLTGIQICLMMGRRMLFLALEVIDLTLSRGLNAHLRSSLEIFNSVSKWTLRYWPRAREERSVYGVK